MKNERNKGKKSDFTRKIKKNETNLPSWLFFGEFTPLEEEEIF